nr:DUF2345 domain-containing protein [Burkholderia multivorans]
MLLSSPEGIAATTQQSPRVTANEHANTVHGKNVNRTVGKSLLASWLQKCSLLRRTSASRFSRRRCRSSCRRKSA